MTTLSANQNSIDIDILSKQAAKEKKYLLLFFHKFGCGFCKKMSNTTFNDEKVASKIEKNFIFVDLGIDDDGEVIHKGFKGSKHAYAKSLEIGFYPTIGFIDGNNSMIYGVIGYRDKEKFLLHLKYITSEAYKTMDYDAFITYLDFQDDL
jgi:thioredoxin-related protein